MRELGCTLGIDLGTTSAKVLAFDTGGRELAGAAEQLELERPAPGAAEQDPAAVYAAVMRALGAVARQVGTLGYRVTHVGMSAAMHSLIPVAADGTPLLHALLWMDQRAAEAAQALWRSPAGPAIYARTGTPVAAMTPLAKLIWLRAQRPDVFNGAARFVSLKEWIWHRWFSAWQVDASLASATGLYNLRARDWDAEALALAGITADRLGALVPTTYVRRDPIAPELAALGAGGVPVAFNIGASDGVLANLGVGAIGPESLVMTIGTSLAVRSGDATPFTDPATRLFCYVLDTDRFIVGGPSNSGGIVLDWLAHLVAPVPGAHAAPTSATKQPTADFADLFAAAEGAHDDDLLCLPYIAGERAPLWDAQARGVFAGLTLGHSGAHLMRAAIEGIVYNARWIAEPLLRRPAPPRQIIASGKVLDVAWIRQLVADVFGLPVRFLGDVDASAFGATALANIAGGQWTWEDVAASRYVPPGALTTPATPERYASGYARFRELSTLLLGRRGTGDSLATWRDPAIRPGPRG